MERLPVEQLLLFNLRAARDFVLFVNRNTNTLYVTVPRIILDIAAFECLKSSKRTRQAAFALMRLLGNCLYVSYLSR